LLEIFPLTLASFLFHLPRKLPDSVWRPTPAARLVTTRMGVYQH
jgi:hypothetical protein